MYSRKPWYNKSCNKDLPTTKQDHIPRVNDVERDLMHDERDSSVIHIPYNTQDENEEEMKNCGIGGKKRNWNSREEIMTRR